MEELNSNIVKEAALCHHQDSGVNPVATCKAMISLHKGLKKLKISRVAAQGDLNATKVSKRISLLQFNAVLKALWIRPGTSRAHNKLSF